MSAFAEPVINDLLNEEQLKSFIDNNKLCVIFFWASWHEPSSKGGQMNQIYCSLAKKYNSVCFSRVEAEAFPMASEKFEVSVVPTFTTLANGSVTGKVEGVNPAELANLLKTLSEMPDVPHNIPGSSSLQKSQELYLKHLVNSAPVMVFMKGSPDAPRCGFSRKICELLKSQEIMFASFDILSDNSVREGLKKLYDWPTYPQVYVSGELIGGLDIVTEMANSGSLKDQMGIVSDVADRQVVGEADLNSRLKRLTRQATVMLFMKGSAEAPRCGFSKTMVSLLNEGNIPFDSFDILSDEEVRQGLKKLYDWPTYPQLYVKGELIGGLDIVKEMVESGPLKDQLDI